MGPMQGLGPWDPSGGERWLPWDPFGGRVGEAEGRHYGGRRPTKCGSGGEAPRNLGPLGPMGPIGPPGWDLTYILLVIYGKKMREFPMQGGLRGF